MAQPNVTKAGSIFEVTCDELSKSFKNCILVDVRPESEFYGELSHIPGSIRHTLGEELNDFLDSYPKKDDQLIFICRRGGRSEMAALQAADKGFSNPVNLLGGMIEWNEKSYPTG